MQWRGAEILCIQGKARAVKSAPRRRIDRNELL
jgi:hypothetical protein